MKTLIITILFLISFVWNGYAQNKVKEKNITIVNKSKKDTLKAGWQKDVTGLINHLNSWDKNELNAYECPKEHPNYTSSGETNGWIEEHKRKLKELGATVFWNKEKKLYELKKE